MITVIRSYTKSGKNIILLVIVASFVIGMLPLAIREVSRSGQWAIRVNGQEIGSREYAQEIEKQRERIAAFRKYYGESADWLLNMMNMGDPRSVAFKSLSRQELVNQFGDTLGIYMSPAYIEACLCNPQCVTEQLGNVVPAQVVDPATGIDFAMLQRYLKHYGVTAEIFERQVERELTDKIVMDVVSAGFYIPQFDVAQKYLTEYGKKSFSIFVINKAKIAQAIKNNPVSDADLQQFYNEQNKTMKNYWIPEKRSGMVWVFEPKNYGITVSDDQINAYYEDNKLKRFIDEPALIQVRRILLTVPNDQSRADVQRKAAAIKDEIIQNPDRFAALAKEVSQDAETAKNGGLLKPFSRGEHEVAFERAAFTLPQDGSISDVIETTRGYEILQRVSKKMPTVKSLAAVKDDIRNELAMGAFTRVFAEDVKKVMDQNSDEAVQAFVKDKGGKLKTFNGVGASEDSLAQYLFKLEPNARSFAIDNGVGVLAQLTTVNKKHLPSLDDVRSAVLADYYVQKTHDELSKKLKEAKALVGASTFKELQGAFDGELIQTGLLDASKENALKDLKEKGIPVDQMLQLEKSGSFLTHQSDENGYVIRLDEISPLDQQEIEAKGVETAQNFEQERIQQYLEGFVASLYRNATIETNESVVTFQE